ncbi:MAG: hypothetical protein WC972_10695 [Trueperaceae bacterium]
MFRFRSFLPFASALAIFLAACSPPPVAKPPYIDLATNQPASVVIGQPDFTSTSETDMTRSFTSTYGRPLLLNGVLYLPDYGAGRVMGYLGVPTANDAAADFVLGRDGFDDFAPGPASARRLGGPQSLATDGTRVFLSDFGFNRILAYDTAPTTTHALADYAIGQPDLTSGGPGCSATSLDEPEGMYAHGGKLMVADSTNNRVLIWNTIPLDGMTPPDVVLGQASFATCALNDDAQSGLGGAAPTARTLYYPTGVWTNGQLLVVADAGNNRVLIWTGFPTASFTPADLVLGQVDFGSDAASAAASGLDAPQSVHGNGTQLFVADTYNNRVLLWNAMPTTNGQPADAVLGQPDLVSALPNGGALSATARGFDHPTGVYAIGNRLLVADNHNHRYLIFEGATTP